MRLGIKIANNPDDIHRLEQTGAKYCEVRFILEEADSFRRNLDYCKRNKIQTNFHFWASFEAQRVIRELADLPRAARVMANPAAPGKLGRLSIDAIKQTIDIAARYKAGYVNIHPGETKLNTIDQKIGCIRPIKIISNPAEAEKIMLYNLKLLRDYADEKKIIITTETVPGLDPEQWLNNKARPKTLDIGKLSFSFIEKIAQQNFQIANDFEHTAANLISSNRNKIYSFLLQKTKALAPKTKLLHIGFIVPPYNGTDYHGVLSDSEFASDKAIPNKKEMRNLLQIFKNRDDIWVVPEPKTDHVKSYKVAQEIINSTRYTNSTSAP